MKGFLMGRDRWRLLFVLLVVWFYGGFAYCQWIGPAVFSGFHGSAEVVVVSREADRILASGIIVVPLAVLSALPVILVRFVLVEVGSTVLEAAFGFHPRYLSDHLASFNVMCPMILAVGMYLVAKWVAKVIRRDRDVRDAVQLLEEIRRRRNPG